MSAHKIYLDCDPGIDDALAIGYLLAAEDVDLLGIGTVSGNTNAAQGATNALALLELAGRTEVPVAVGSNDFLHGNYDGGAPHVHGARGTGAVELPAPSASPVEESAVDMLLRLSHDHAGELHIIAVGPLTNIARAVEKDPTLPRRVARVTIMGGAALVPGNVSQAAEANIKHDPEGAQVVFGAPWDITVVPLDVTLTNTFEEEDRQALAASGQFGRHVAEMLDYYFQFYVGFYGRRAAALHDPLAAAIAVEGISAAVAPIVRVRVDCTTGTQRGRVICDLPSDVPVESIPDTPGANVAVVLRTTSDLAPQLREALVSL
ncbi:nucleoside hydrolase [Helcobacillus sp. ACRRO]|uniref:nucleoside hydrolase n=1 Tax=Helcobacillus sp. ACRRO TaxID=2918202 RepID=UPI001EF5F043|nr:nucleoside hydrolase [Helcobacillus sp. ACRRO]